jgi:hypothetical protein
MSKLNLKPEPLDKNKKNLTIIPIINFTKMETYNLFALQDFTESDPQIKKALQENKLKTLLDETAQKLGSFGISQNSIQAAQKIQTQAIKNNISVGEKLEEQLKAQHIQAEEIKNYIYILLTLQLKTEQEKLENLNSFIESCSPENPESEVSIEIHLSNFLAQEILKFTSNLAQAEKIKFVTNLTRAYRSILLETTTKKQQPKEALLPSETEIEKSSTGLTQYLKQNTSFLEFIYMQGTHRNELLKSYSKKSMAYIRQIDPELRSLKRIAIKDVIKVAQHIFQLNYKEEHHKVIKILKEVVHNNNLTLQEFIQLDLQKLTNLPTDIVCSLVTEKQIQFISEKHLEESYNQIKSKKRYNQIKYDTTSELKLPTLSQIQEIKKAYTLDSLILSNIPSDKNFDELFNYYPINKDQNGYAFILSTIYNLPNDLTKELRNNLNYIPDFIKDHLRHNLQNDNSLEEALKTTFQSHIPAELTSNYPYYHPSTMFSILKTINDIHPQTAANFYPIKKVLETVTPDSKLFKILTIPIFKSQDLNKLKSRKMSTRMIVVNKLSRTISAQSPTNLDAYFKLKNLSREDYPPQNLDELLTEHDLNKDNFLEKFYKIPLNIQVLICYLKRKEISIPTIKFLYRAIFQPNQNITLVTPPPNYKYDPSQLSPTKNDRQVDHVISEQGKQPKLSCRHFFTEEYFNDTQNIKQDIKQIQQLKSTNVPQMLNSKITTSNQKEIVVKVYLSEYASLQYELNKVQVDDLIQSQTELIEILNELIDLIK